MMITQEFAKVLCATQHFIVVLERTNKVPFAEKIAHGVDLKTSDIYEMVDRGDWERGLVFWNHKADMLPRGYDIWKARGHRMRKPENEGRKKEKHLYKEILYEAQQGKCHGCLHHFPLALLTIDHIVARSRGGENSLENYQLLCKPCNQLKADRTHPELIDALVAKGILKAHNLKGNNLKGNKTPASKAMWHRLRRLRRYLPALMRYAGEVSLLLVGLLP